MKKIKLKDFTIIPLEETVKHEDIDDEQYFANYKDYVSCSKLHKISPRRNGSMDNYYNPKKFGYSEALDLGTIIHCQTLQPYDFQLSEKIGKPNSKKGAVIDKIVTLRKQGYSIYDAIIKACQEVDYYSKSVKSQLKNIISSDCLKYYLTRRNLDENTLVPSDGNYDTVISCINSLKENKEIQNKLHPVDVFGEEYPSYMEDTLYEDILVKYKDKEIVIHCRGKLDNWTVDVDNKRLILNDLKTSSDYLGNEWIAKDGHFMAFGYDMQCYMYKLMLEALAKLIFNYNEDWDFECNILAVQTRWNYISRCFHVTKSNLKTGKECFEDAIKRVAYYELFGHDEEVEFI